jgi:hypothetical protein
MNTARKYNPEICVQSLISLFDYALRQLLWGMLRALGIIMMAKGRFFIALGTWRGGPRGLPFVGV